MLLNIVRPIRNPGGVFHNAILFLFLVTSTVTACRGHSNSNPSPVVTPFAPIAVTAVAGNNTVTLSWNAVTSATSYNIYRSTLGLPGTKIGSAGQTSYQDATAANATTYYYALTAVNSAGESAVSGQVSATPTGTSPTSVTISGKAQYQDKQYGLNGFTGSAYKAIRYAYVELVVSSASYTTLTDSNGSFTFVNVPLSPTASAYVRLEAEATPPGSPSQIQVKDMSAKLYSVAGSNFSLTGEANVNISVPSTSIGGAFNILDVFTNGSQFVYSLAGAYPPRLLSAFWQKGNTRGTYYCPQNDNDPTYCVGGEGIYVLNTTTDTDEYDDDVLYHEFGHFTAACFSRDDSPGGAHGLTDIDLDMRLSWSEGWGDSFPGAVKLWLSSDPLRQNLLSSAGVPLTEYVDTNSRGAGLAIDMGNPDGTYAPAYNYACGEVAIAKILLDLNNSFGMQSVWKVVSDFSTSPSSSTTNPVNLELFWDRWHSLGNPTAAAAPSTVTIDSIFQGRFITYSTNKNVVSTSTYTVDMSGEQQHTISGDGNLEYVAFAALQGSPYTITTFNLKNGTDTYITLLNSDMTTMTTTTGNPNDNLYPIPYSGLEVPSDRYHYLCDPVYDICHENGGDILRSSLTYTAASSGTYYLKVQSSPTRPVSAGRYGAYSLRITSP